MSRLKPRQGPETCCALCANSKRCREKPKRTRQLCPYLDGAGNCSFPSQQDKYCTVCAGFRVQKAPDPNQGKLFIEEEKK